MLILASQHRRSFAKELVWALQAYIQREQKRTRTDGNHLPQKLQVPTHADARAD